MAPLGPQELQRGAEPPDVYFALGFRGLTADGPEDSFAVIDYDQVPEDSSPSPSSPFRIASRTSRRSPRTCG